MTLAQYHSSAWVGYGVHARQDMVAISTWFRQERRTAGPVPFIDNSNLGPSLATAALLCQDKHRPTARRHEHCAASAADGDVWAKLWLRPATPSTSGSATSHPLSGAGCTPIVSSVPQLFLCCGAVYGCLLLEPRSIPNELPARDVNSA
jgi:hypothetical protein